MSFLTVHVHAHKRAVEREAREVAEREAREATASIRTLLANHLVVGAFYAIEAAKPTPTVDEMIAAATATEMDLTDRTLELTLELAA